jgi:flagellar protein FlaH
MCDAHLRLRIETMGTKLTKILEVAKIRGATQKTGNIITFDVEPNWGIKVIPYAKARA